MKRVMSNVLPLLALLLLPGVAISSDPAVSTDPTAEVTVSGSVEKPGTFVLGLDFQPGLTDRADAVLVYAEPSHTLLVAHWNGSARPELLGNREDRAMATTEGVFGKSAPRVTLAFDTARQERIVVQVLYGVKRLTVSDAKVNMAKFSFSTRFSPGNVGWRHCCSCGACGTMCEDCDTSRFTCNCVTCTISCGW